tara:strand:+ start:5520 stop:6338 length:819 start_codon:yes stop_codon:yes gene_type:complete
MSNKFEQLLELLINEENDKAEQLFHEIVVEKSRDIYEGLAETTEESKDETVEETKEEAKEEAKEGEEVEIEEESIEEVGGDATDDLIKDVSAEEEGEMDAMGDENGEENNDTEVEDTEERVADLEDALDELKAEFEKMMGNENGEEGTEEESLETTVEEPLANEIQPMEAKEVTKETVKEYKIQKSADTADHSDKGAKSPVNASVKSAGGTVSNIAKGGAEEKGRPAPTAAKMAGNFENTGGKDKSTSFKKQEKANTADGSDKSAKSPVASK